MNKNKSIFLRKKLRIRAKLAKVNRDLPRLSVMRSNKHILAQIIDLKNKGKILVAASDKEVSQKNNKTEKAAQVGSILAKKALAKKIKNIVFDRSGYAFKGRISVLAKACREGGLKF